MLISNAKSLNVKQSITFTFKEDIDKVFNCFFNPKILTKLGFFNNKITKEHFPLKKVKFEYKNSSNTIELDTTEEIEKSDMKIVKRQIKKINDIPVESNLFIKYNFYINTSNYSTLVILETEYDNEADYILYQNLVCNNKKNHFCQLIKKYLRSYNNIVHDFHYESIVIHRSLQQTFLQITNIREFLRKQQEKYKSDNTIKYSFNEFIMRKDQIILKLTRSFEGKNSGSNKMNVILYKLSPISCCLFLETQIPYNIKGKFHSFLSSYQQFFLKEIKEYIEKTMLADVDEVLLP